MNKLLIFNWKMNPDTLLESQKLAKLSDHKNVAVIPPFPFLEKVGNILKNAELGAQDLFWKNPLAGGAAFTGEVSADELKNVGVKYVLIGHSERRKLGETDEIIARKMRVALAAGLIPILCVGETEKEKNEGKEEGVIKQQLKDDLFLIKGDFIVAYEPVWAIGTSEPETPASALKIIQFIKKTLSTFNFPPSTKVLYGGSATSQNLADYIKYKEIDGVLVGGASLKKEEIKKMIQCLN